MNSYFEESEENEKEKITRKQSKEMVKTTTRNPVDNSVKTVERPRFSSVEITQKKDTTAKHVQLHSGGVNADTAVKRRLDLSKQQDSTTTSTTNTTNRTTKKQNT
jgi:hypothetical protein